MQAELLRAATPRAWIDWARREPALLLVDHANCEKKAASTALALMFTYAEDLHLTQALSRLAREELRHYEQVIKLMRSLSIEPMRLTAGRYAERLRRLVSRAEPQRELDLMICGAFIEARSCERFAALAPCMPEAIGALFGSLHAAERRHQGLYQDLALRASRRHGLALDARIEEFALLEAQLVQEPDENFRFHSGPPAASLAGAVPAPASQAGPVSPASA